MLLLFSNACLADEILKRDQVEVPVEEYLDGVATGKQSLLSFVIKSDRKDVRWDICMIGFEANNSKKNVRATVYRIANSSDRPSIPDEPMTKLLVWTPHKEAKFEVVSGSYKYQVRLTKDSESKTKTGWKLKAVGSFKRVSNEPIQKFEFVQLKEVSLGYTIIAGTLT
jgi:hypothetical protein